MTPKQKEWIDSASYRELLSKWRFAPVGDVLLQGDAGLYFEKALHRKRDEVGHDEHVRISKDIGW